jgi:predicted O-methyltransferase YrrM
MKFTQDWFSTNVKGIEQCLDKLKNKSSFLEIGCFEGRSTCWLLEHMNDGIMYSIDNFIGDGDYKVNGEALYETAKNNIAEATKSNQTHILMRTTSYKGLSELILKDIEFDFIYVDGSHDPRDVLVDTCMAWGLLKKNGVMMFDDAGQEKVQKAIIKFADIFNNDFKIVFDGYQMGIQKYD